MDVEVSMAVPREKRIYHLQGCIYAKKIRPENRMTISKMKAEKKHYHCCKYCGGLRGEIRANKQIQRWQKKEHIQIDYVKQSDAAYVRTEIGCWRIYYDNDTKKYKLYHRNTYSTDLTLDQSVKGRYHRQSDVKPEDSLHKLINYIVAHDKAKVIMKEGYRKLPHSTKRQQRYYRQAETKFRRQEKRRTSQILDDLFRMIENENPRSKKTACC